MTETKRDANAYLASEPIGRLLLKFSVPCVLSMLVSALYNIVDQIFIGQSVGYLGNAATNVVYPFTVTALALALLVGDGSAAKLSLSLGSGDKENSHKCIGNGILATIIIGLLLTVTGFLFTDQILRLFGVTEASYPYARESMFSTVIGAVLNLILDPVAIFVFHMGVRGAAIATVIGQVVSCFVTILYFRKPKSFRFSKASFLPDGRLLRQIGQLGISSFITQIAIVIVMSVSNNMIGLKGPQSIYGADIPLSVVGIVMKVFGIVIAFSVGIAVGGQPIAGYNYGAGNFKRVFDTYRHIIAANAVIGIIATLLFEFCPQVIVSLFGSESGLYNEYANMCFRIFLGGILLCCVQKASSIFLQSIGKPVKATVLSLSRDVVFLVPGVILLSMAFGVTGMLWAAPIADVLSLILTIILVSHEYKCLKRMEVRTHESSNHHHQPGIRQRRTYHRKNGG